MSYKIGASLNSKAIVFQARLEHINSALIMGFLAAPEWICKTNERHLSSTREDYDGSTRILGVILNYFC
jgi:hypothetical protein